MSLDLGFLTHQFIERLPGSFAEWQSQVNQNFPYLYDTKTMSVCYNGRDNLSHCDLAYLFKKCLNDKKFCNNLAFSASSKEFDYTSSQSHDAGYDAYMTGVVFGTFAKYTEIG